MPDLPTFNSGSTYLLKGETLQSIMDWLHEQKVVLTGKKQFDEVGPEGSKLNLDSLLPPAPFPGTYVLASIDAVVEWLPTDICKCESDEIDGGEP